MDARVLLSGNRCIWCNITIPASSASASDLWTLAKAGFSAAEDALMERIIAWKVFKEKDTALAAYSVGDDASLTVAKSFGANEECSSADYPLHGHGLKTIFLGAAADAAITAGFYAIIAPTKA